MSESNNCKDPEMISSGSDWGEFELADIIDAASLQKLLDDFYAVARIPVGILDTEGRVLVKVGWQAICTKFHRVQPETCRYCLESDTQLSAGLAQGEFRLYKCKNNLWDMATPIFVAGRHVGNIFTGQFFFDDERIDYEFFRLQARKYRFDEESYIAALKQVPLMNRTIVERGMAFFLELADTLSQLGYTNIRLTRLLSERQQLTTSLQESEERFRLMFQGHGAAMLLIEPESGAIVDANDAATVFYGYSRKQFQSMRIDQINVLPREDIKKERNNAVQFHRNRFIFQHRLSNGQFRWVEVYSSPVKIKDRPTLFSIIHDITERKQAEDALRQSEERFRLLAQTAEKLLKSADPQTVIDDLCPKVMEFLDCQVFFNYLLDDTNGRLHLNTYAGIPESEALKITSSDMATAVCGCVAQSGERIIAENIAQSSDAMTELVRSFGVQAYCCHPLKVHNQLVGTLSFGTRTKTSFSDFEIEVMRTISDQVAVAMQRIQTEKKLIDLNANLEQRIVERTAQATSLTLQLRELAAELTLSEQRERQRLSRILHDGLQQILVAAKYRLAISKRTDNSPTTDQIIDLIDDAIATSRSLTAELSPPILMQGDLFTALEWLTRWMHDKYDLHVSLKAHEIHPLPEEVLLLLFQAARELLFNVVKHAGVKTAHIETTQLNGNIIMQVEDKGSGFDVSQLRTEGGQSGGIGLFSITERFSYLGGHAEIDSEPGRGSRFTLTIPLSQPGVARDLSLMDEYEPVSAEATSQLNLKPAGSQKKIRIMLVDDHKVMRQGLASVIKAESDFEIVGESSDGESAVKLAGEIWPDVILMDIGMPVMDGIQATRIIHTQFPKIQIIGFSMFQEPEQEAAIRAAGAIDFLTKSEPSESVIAAIRRLTPSDKSCSHWDRTA